MVQNGHKVAICEQVEDPKQAKGIVKREVVRVVTPGLVVDTDTLDPRRNNYLMALVITSYSIHYTKLYDATPSSSQSGVRTHGFPPGIIGSNAFGSAPSAIPSPSVSEAKGSDPTSISPKS